MRGTDGATASAARRRRLITPLACLIIGWVGISLSGWAQDGTREVVGDVRVVGNSTIGTEQVLRYIQLRPGKEYSQSALMDDVNRLTRARLFKSVRPREQHLGDGQVILTFEVQEFPSLVSDIVFMNNHTVGTEELEKMTGLRRGLPLDPATNRRACYEIQDYLKSKGRYFANVTLLEGDRAGDKRVVFNLTEGPKVVVRAIRFTGNDFATEGRLKTQVDSSTAFFTYLGGVFQPGLVDNDVIKIGEYYKSHGFLEARVTRELQFSDDNRLVDVIFHVREGRRYQVESVAVMTEENKEELTSIVQAKAGDWYRKGVTAGDVTNIRDFHGWRGKQVAVEERVYTVPDQPGVVRVQYEVRDAAPAKVGRVFVVGNDVTKDRVIRRVVGLYPGQTLRYPELRIAERDLARLNIFETSADVRPTLTVLDTDSEYKDILVQVKETTTGSLLFGAGFNSNAGLVGSVVLNERNFDLLRFPTSFGEIFEGKAFRGAGQEFRLEAVPGTQLQRYTISFREPFLFDRPYSLTTSGYYNDRIYTEYQEGRLGGRFGVGHQITKEWSIAGNVRIENVNVSQLASTAPIDYTSVRGSNFLVAPRLGVSYDTRDSFMRPTEGGILEMAYEHVLGDFNFPIMSVVGSRYFTTFQRADGSGKHVLAARSHVAWAGDDAPVFERFYAGGFQSLRGFQFRGAQPFVNGYAVGGNFMFLNSLEYQIPIKANDSLYVVGFLDTGTVESNVSLANYRVSVGVGLRISVPALGPVPIALDFGVPIMKAPQDQEQIFSFWVGMFR